MSVFDKLKDDLARAAASAQSDADRLRRALSSDADRLRRALSSDADRLRRSLSGDRMSLSTFVRPELGATPAPLRKFLEPVVALTALMALAYLGGLAFFGVGLFAFAAVIIYWIITEVFGLELDLNVPPNFR